MSPRARGLFYIAISAFCFAVMSTLTKITTDPEALPAGFFLRERFALQPVSPGEAVFYRSALGWMGLMAAVRLLRVRLSREHPRLLVLRGVLGGLAILCFFYAIAHTKLSKAALLAYAYPVFATGFAWFFLGERLRAGAAAVMAAALAGVGLMLRPDPASGFNLGDAAAVLASVFSGGAIATLRRLRREDATLAIVLQFTFWCAAVSLPFLFVRAAPGAGGGFRVSVPDLPDGPHAGMLAAIALSAAIGQLLLTAAYRHCTTSEGSTMSVLNAVFAVAFGILVFGESLAWTTWVGGAMTLGACGALMGMGGRGETPKEKSQLPMSNSQ